MNKILNILIGLLMVLSLATAVSATMPKYDLDTISIVVEEDPASETISQAQLPTYHYLGLMSMNQNTYGFNQGRFFKSIFDAYAPLNIGLNIVEDGTHTLVYMPDEGFDVDYFAAFNGVSIVNQFDNTADILVSGDGAIIVYYSDVQAPTVTTEGGIYWSYGGPMYVTIRADVADNDVVASVTLSLNGVDYGMTETSPGAYEYSLSLAPGTHPYTVTAVDASNLTSTASSNVTVNLVTIPNDTQPPTVAIDPSTPTVLGSLYGGPINFHITANAADNDGVSNIMVNFNGIVFYLDETSPGVWEGDTTVTMGSYSYTLTAQDWAGNTATANGQLTVYAYAPIVTEPPEVHNLANQTVNAGSNNQATVTITADATDDYGIASVTVTVDNATSNMTFVNGSTYTYTVALSAGTHNVVVTALDAAGQTGTASATITVNPYTAPNNGGNTGSNGGSSSSSRRHNGPVRGTWTPVQQPVQPVAPSNGGIVEQPQEVVPVEPAPVEPKPAEIMQPEPKKSFWNIFKVAAFNVLLLTLILLAILVFR